MPRKSTSAKDRFWDHVKLSNFDNCWEWQSTKDKDGYGTITEYGKHKKRNRIRAHRLSWMIHFGEIPEGMCVCHHCDSPSCVRPDHLWIGSPKDNTQDMLSKGRGPKTTWNTGEDNGNSRLTEGDVLEIRRLWNFGFLTMRYISKMFCIGERQISYIIHKQSWKHI